MKEDPPETLEDCMWVEIAALRGGIAYERWFAETAYLGNASSAIDAGWVTPLPAGSFSGFYAYHPPISTVLRNLKTMLFRIAQDLGFDEHVYPRHYAEDQLLPFAGDVGPLDGSELFSCAPRSTAPGRIQGVLGVDPIQCAGFYALLKRIQEHSGGALPEKFASPVKVYEDQGGWTLRNEISSRLLDGWGTAIEIAGSHFIYCGTGNAVADIRWELLEAITRLLEELRITHRIVVPEPRGLPGRSVEAVSSAKCLEIEVLVDGSRRHGEVWIELGGGELFGTSRLDAFGIRIASDEPLTSGCQGVGLQRLALAVVAQHGLYPESWPRTLTSPPGPLR